MKTVKSYPKYKLSKWFLMLPLFFSVFAFSGYSGKASSLQQKNIQTELVVSNKPKAAKHTVIFTSTQPSALESNYLHKTREQEVYYLFAFNCLEQVNYRSISKQIYLHNPDIHLLHIRTYSLSPDEDNFS